MRVCIVIAWDSYRIKWSPAKSSFSLSAVLTFMRTTRPSHASVMPLIMAYTWRIASNAWEKWRERSEFAATVSLIKVAPKCESGQKVGNYRTCQARGPDTASFAVSTRSSIPPCEERNSLANVTRSNYGITSLFFNRITLDVCFEDVYPLVLGETRERLGAKRITDADNA